jgi:hypothetical protein
MAGKALVASRPGELGRPAPRGIEAGDPDDLLIPKVLLMQGLSKLVTREGKKAGTFVNSLTKEEMGTEVKFVPVVMTKYFDLLKMGGDGKMAFEGRTFDKNDPRLKGRRMFNEGDLKANANSVMSFICVVNGEPVVINFSKTSYKTGKKLYTLTQLGGFDLFSKQYKLTVKAAHKGDNDYFEMEVEMVGEAPKGENVLAESLYASLGKRVHEFVDQGPSDEPGAPEAQHDAASPAQEPEGSVDEPPEEKPEAAKAVAPAASEGFVEDTKPQFTKVRVIIGVRTDEDKKCRKCGKLRDLKEGTVKTLDPETNLPWGKVKALVCRDCNLLDVVEKLPDPK